MKTCNLALHCPQHTGLRLRSAHRNIQIPSHVCLLDFHAPRNQIACKVHPHHTRYRSVFVPSASANNGAALPGIVAPSVVTDAAVPEGHKGLHGFLYGDGGAEVHGGPSGRQYDPRPVRALSLKVQVDNSPYHGAPVSCIGYSHFLDITFTCRTLGILMPCVADI
jgi:hypothetical protein